MGLIWALILRYQIAGPAPTDSDSPKKDSEAQKKKASAKKLLLNWVNSTFTDGKASNFTTDWNDGLRLSALVDYCKPGLIPDHASLDPNNRLENVTRAMDLAKEELGVPQVMHPEDLAVDKPDELSVMTYVSGFCRPGQQSLLDWVNSKIPNQPVSNFTTDWADGRALGALTDSVSEGGFPDCEQMKADDGTKNCQDAMEAAENLLAVEKIVSPEEFAETDMDHLTRSAYVGQFRNAKPVDKEPLVSTLKAVGPGVSGDSVEKETNFVVRGPRIPQWADVGAVVKSADGTELPVREQKTSPRSQQFFYKPEEPGDYTVAVTFNDTPIPGSVFNVTHIPPTNVDGCVATGSGLSKARVGEPAGFSVNCEQGGPGDLQVDVEGPNGNVEVEKDEAAPKNYNVAFTPSEAGDHLISVLWDNKDIPSSPFSCMVTDPKKCSVSGPGLSKACVGEPMNFSVKTDKAGEGKLEVSVDGPDGSTESPDVSQDGGSNFDVTYVPKQPGPHKVNVLWSGAPIAGSPFNVNVAAPADASKCQVSNLPEGRLRANDTYSFDVDASGAGSGELKASAHGPTVPESCSVKDKGDGLYSVNFTPAEVGPLKVDVAYGDETIPDSPFNFTVNDPAKVKVNRAAVENAEYLVNQPVQFVVSAGHAGEGDVKATIKNPNGENEMELKDQGGKSYLLSYSPETGGAHAINITFDGCEIPDGPIRIFVDDSNRADKVVVTQPLPSKIGAYLVDAPYEYKVSTGDAGTDELTVTCEGANTGSQPPVKIENDGSEKYSAVVCADTPDLYTVNVKWGGEHVPGSPFTLNVEDQPQPENVVCVGPDYEVGSPKPVTLTADVERAGAGKLSATCSGSDTGSIPVEITETQPKKYLVSFSPPKEDVYSLNVMWHMDSVNDSPFKINLISPDASKCIVSGPEVPLEPSEPIVLYVDASNAGNGKLTTSSRGDKTGEKQVTVNETEENKFVLSFVPELTDFYTWDVKWGGSDVNGAPFRVHSTAANADKVMICEPPSAMLEAGQAIGICFDTSKGGKGTLTASCKGKSVGEIPISLQRRVDDPKKYDVRFLPPEPDIFFVTVQWSGLDVKGSPFTINLMPVDVNKIKVVGPSQPHGPEGPVDMMLQTAGAGRGKVTGTCDGDKAGRVEVVIKETSADVYELCFIPPQPDIYKFNVQYGGQTINGSPFTLNTLPADASQVKVTEPDTVDLAKPLTFEVDSSEAGAGKLTAGCRGDKCGQVPMEILAAEAPNQYRLTFTPTQPDLYKVYVEWDGKSVAGSPFKVDLRPPMANKVKVGELHVPEDIGSNNYVWLDLDCTEAGHGPLKGEAKGKVAGRMPIEADRLARAKYRMKFLPSQHDMYNFAVAYGDSQVQGSPFKVNLVPPQGDKVKLTRTTLPEFEGGPVALYFDTSEAGKGEMTAEIKSNSAKSVTKKVEKVSPTEHKVTFIPDTPDVYDAHVLWSGEPVKDSPFKVDTRPPLHPELIECGTPMYSDVNEPVTLAVDTRKAGPGRITAECRDSDKAAVPVEVKRPTSPIEKYDISFMPTRHDTYQLSVFFEGDQVKGSPFPVNLNPVVEMADMKLIPDVESFLIPCDFSEPPAEDEVKQESPELQAFIGEPLSMDISAEDEDKRQGKLMVSARGDKVGPTDVEVRKNGESFSLCFNPTIPDRYTIKVSINDEEIPNSPIIITYAYPVDASKCKIFGLQNVAPVPQVDEPIEFGVDAKEAGDGKLSVTSDGPSQEDRSSELTVQESEKEPGIYNVTYLPTAMGEHRVHLLWSGDKIPGAPLIFKVGDIHKVQRYPHNKPVNIDINTDSKPGDLESYAIQEETGAKSKVKINKEKKGKYKLSFQPKQPGIYAVHVLHKKKETPGSPYRIRYLGPANTNGVTVTDFPGKGRVDTPITFSVNAEEAGTGELSMRVEGPVTVNDADLTYARSPLSKELCYDVNYVPRHPGDHFFHLLWAGKPIPSSPLKADVTDSAPVIKTPLKGQGTNVVEVGAPATVTILNGGGDLSADSITAQCDGTKATNVDVEISKDESDDDKHVVKFVPEVADNYTLGVKVNGEDIEGSPFSVKAVDKERLSPGFSFPPGPLLSDVDAGEPVNFVCDAPGANDPSDITMSVEGPYGSCPPTVFTDTGSDQVGLSFIPPLSGEYTISAQKDGADLGSCPCKLRAAGKDPDASKVTILDKDMAVFENPIPFGKPARFRISTVDAGPGTLNITSKGPGKAKVKVLDNKDGSYTCEFTPSIAGKYHIDILWNDHHISGSPYLLTFKSKKNKVIAGLNLQDEDFRVDVPHRFKLHCGDVGQGILEIITKPPSAAAVRLTPIPPSNNSYQCEIIPKEVGNHQVIVQYNGKHIMGSPFNVQFDKRGDASKCRLVESNISGQESDQEHVNFVIATDNAGRGKLTATIERSGSQTQLPVSVTQLPDNEKRFKVEFDPEEDQEYLLNIKYDNDHIHGSPFKLMFGGDAADASQCTAEGDGIHACIVDRETKFVVNTLRPNRGELSVSIKGEKTIVPAMSPVGSTRTEVSYVADQPGQYEISVKWANQEISDSPFLVQCYHPLDPGLLIVENPPAEVYINNPVNFSVKTLAGVAGDGVLTVTSQSSANKAGQGRAEKSDDGLSYNCSFDPFQTAGKYLIHVRWNGAHVKRSPFKLTVLSRPCPENVKAYGPGLEDGFIGQEGNFTVETEDGGPGTLAVRVHGPKGAFKINMRRHPDNERTILVRYDPNHIGKYTVDITWSDIHVPGSPFKVDFADQNNVSLSVACVCCCCCFVHTYNWYTVKPPVKDTPKEDKPPNKGQAESTLVYTLYRKSPLKEDSLFTKDKTASPEGVLNKRFHVLKLEGGGD